MAKTKTIYSAFARQEQDWDCGPACLKSLAVIYKVSERKIQRALKDSGANPNTGTSEAGMVRALDAMSLLYRRFSVDSKKMAVRFLRAAARSLPAVVCVDNDDHWVIVYGFVDDKWVVFDPEKGLNTLSNQSFVRRWTSSTGNYSFIVTLGKY